MQRLFFSAILELPMNMRESDGMGEGCEIPSLFLLGCPTSQNKKGEIKKFIYPLASDANVCYTIRRKGEKGLPATKTTKRTTK